MHRRIKSQKSNVCIKYYTSSEIHIDILWDILNFSNISQQWRKHLLIIKMYKFIKALNVTKGCHTNLGTLLYKRRYWDREWQRSKGILSLPCPLNTPK